MNILAINGSHRGEKGYSQILIDKFFEGARQLNTDCDTIVLKNYKINQCLGCRACHKPEHYLKCVYEEKDDVKGIFDRMREADILVFATPIYIFNMTGLMKVFLDRITSTADSSIMTTSDSGLFFHHIDKKLISKPFVLITTQDNIENETSKNVLSYFKTFSSFLDAPFVGYIRRKNGSLIGYGKDLEKEKQYPIIALVNESIKKAGFEIVRYNKIKKKTEKQCNRNIISMPRIIEFLLKISLFRNNKVFMSKLLEEVKKIARTHNTLYKKMPGQ
jgi:multimeric flavodoxin WrbA